MKEFKIGAENELPKEDHFREVIERVKTKLIKESTKKYFITITWHSPLFPEKTDHFDKKVFHPSFPLMSSHQKK